jgi:hypothetical protein
MGFLPILLPIVYVGFYLFFALAAYACFSVVAERDALGKQLFWSVLAFGAWAAIGYILSAIVVVLLIHFKLVFILQPEATFSSAPFFSVAYILPGILGSWLTIRILDGLRRKKDSSGNSPSPST